MEGNALFAGGFDFFGVGRHIHAGAPVHDVHFGRPQPPGGAGRIHGHVAAADDRHPTVLDRRRTAEGHLPEEIRAVDDPCGLLARDPQAQAAMRPDGDDDGLEAFVVEQILQPNVAAERPVADDLHTGSSDVVDLDVEDLARQAVFGDPHRHHAARDG